MATDYRFLTTASCLTGKLQEFAGFDGFVSLHSKTKLIDHYIKTLEAYHFGGHLMIVDTLPAKSLIEKYFK